MSLLKEAAILTCKDMWTIAKPLLVFLMAVMAVVYLPATLFLLVSFGIFTFAIFMGHYNGLKKYQREIAADSEKEV